MSEPQHPAHRFVGPLKDLAEGRTDPEAWLAWWAAHADELQAVCLPGWFIRLRPPHFQKSPNDAALHSQQGACIVLEGLKVSFERSERYQQVWQQEFEPFRSDRKTEQLARAKMFNPRIEALAGNFPKLARFLKKRISEVDELEEPAKDEEIVAAEKSLGMPLPTVFRSFLQCTKALSLDGLSLRLQNIWPHPAKVSEPVHDGQSVCIGEYWLENDGDQVLLEFDAQPRPDPPVFYYAHASGSTTARKLAPSFGKWLESLPRSPLFRR